MGSLGLRSRTLASRLEGYSTRAGAGALSAGEGITVAAAARPRQDRPRSEISGGRHRLSWDSLSWTSSLLFCVGNAPAERPDGPAWPKRGLPRSELSRKRQGTSCFMCREISK